MQMRKLRTCFQGSQTRLFFNDFYEKNFRKLINFDDVSKSRHPLKQKLTYFQGLDKSRNKNHGQLKMDLKAFELHIYPKRNFNRYTDRLVVSCFDIEYEKKCVHGRDLKYERNSVHKEAEGQSKRNSGS